ncbi:MAG: N-formylglutamate amidohydrolase [Myxococcales bacterium]|nr:N-formylglutamate amidohydrolase [Myxococcales bacterium]
MSIQAQPFDVIQPKVAALPILVSVPHCGSLFPEELRSLFLPEHLQHPDDTDWFVDQLYDFAPAMGITMLVARYSRYVIDLNRDPHGKPLYNDGRVITELAPTRTFADQPLYQGTPPSEAEVEQRKERYFAPYHQQIQSILAQLQQQHPHVLLWDAHSIRKHVPTIRTQPFPDLILGNQDGNTASSVLIETTIKHLSQDSTYQFSHNDPFKGGYITRHFGRPTQGVHALQLEMAKTLYMDEGTTTYQPQHANKIRDILKRTLEALARDLEHLDA